jgi:alpha-amylase
MSEINGVMMQYFHWYLPADGTLWRQVASEAKELAEAGFSSLWLPPAYKGASGGMDVGYGVYDLFDLGEFEQKSSVRTKYGSKEEYLRAILEAKNAGIKIYADVVFNHKMGGDAEEESEAIPLSFDNRDQQIGDYQKIKAWTHFSFLGRKNKYSSMQWHWWHFSAVDHNMLNPDTHAIYLLKGKDFDRNVDLEKGNYDYLMGCDLDVNHPEVAAELRYWGEWYLDTTGVDGFRFDAVKHVDAEYFQSWLESVRKHANKDLFAVGEYWSYKVEALHHFLGVTDGKVSLFDAPLHFNFYLASKGGRDYDLRKIFDGTLVQDQPSLAVTIVDNHDTQPLQALESPVEAWFKPLAYALILLRAEGYPCVFYPDYYGATYSDKGKDGNDYQINLGEHRWLIDKFLSARKHFAHGEQYTYFDHPNVIGWTRIGTEEHSGTMAVVLSNGDDGNKWMEIKKPNAIYYDVTGHIEKTVMANSEGWGDFYCKGGKVSVWLPKG